MIFYPIHRGEFVAIDDEDLPLVEPYYWAARRTNTSIYAINGYHDGIYRPLHMHRLILNAPKGLFVDHINGNGLDNRRCNLRLCTASQNQANRRRLPTNKTGHRGVCRVGVKWQAGIKKDGRSRHLGWFATAEEAGRAYDAAAKELFGEFAQLNFPVNLAA